MTFILKVTTGCNLRCSYCAVGEKTTLVSMSEKKMTNALDYIAAYAIARQQTSISILFHGGEPLLLPVSQYAACIQHFIVTFPQLSPTFLVQTNGTLITNEWIDLFRRYHFSVGVSFDGNQMQHDRQRSYANGGPTYASVLLGIRQLKAAEIPVSTLMVLTKSAISEPLDYIDVLGRLGVSIKINPLLCCGEAEKHPEMLLAVGDYAKYLSSIYRYLFEKRINIIVEPLMQLMTAILHNKTPRGCVFDADCCERFMCIDVYGRIFPCGRFADMEIGSLGTIDAGISEQGMSFLAQLGELRGTGLPTKCRQCTQLRFCHGGCNADLHDMNVQHLSKAYSLCEDNLLLLHFLQTEGLDLLLDNLYEERTRLLGIINETGEKTDAI